MLSGEVVIFESGRCGVIEYREGDQTAKFDYEFGGRNAIVLIWSASAQMWEKRYPWAVGRQAEIYEFVATEAIRQKSPTSGFEIDLARGHISIVKLQDL